MSDLNTKRDNEVIDAVMECDSLPTAIISILSTCAFMFSIYLSFRCNKEFNLWEFIASMLFFPIYLPYKLATC